MYHIYILITRPFAEQKEKADNLSAHNYRIIPLFPSRQYLLCFLLGSVCFDLSRFLCRLKGFLGGFNGFLCVFENVSLYAALKNLGCSLLIVLGSELKAAEEGVGNAVAESDSRERCDNAYGTVPLLPAKMLLRGMNFATDAIMM